MKISESSLRASLEASVKRHCVPGASVAVFQDGKVTAATSGIANISTGVEVTPETVMHIHSITKIFTATLVMQLVDEKRIVMDERVLRYLPELKLKDCKALEQITVKMLLNHTSGIDGDMLPDHGHDEETIEHGIRRFAELGQLFRPGTQCSYSNAATVIAGYLVQRVRGKSWYRLIKELIFEPLGMLHAVTLPEEALLHRASVGHLVKPGSGGHESARTSLAFLPLSFAPAGASLMMSAADLISFARAHLESGLGTSRARILSAQSAEAMREMTVNNEHKGYTHPGGIGIGWMVSEDGLLHHGGGGVGNVSMLCVHPERKFAAAILTNSERGSGVVDELLEPWLTELGCMSPFGVEAARVAGHDESDALEMDIDLNRYVGVYEDVLNRYRVSRNACGLAASRQAKFACDESMSTEATAPVGLSPLGRDQFLMKPGSEDGPSSEDEGRRSNNALLRVVAFRDADDEGRMRYLGNSLRLYPRVA